MLCTLLIGLLLLSGQPAAGDPVSQSGSVQGTGARANDPPASKPDDLDQLLKQVKEAPEQDLQKVLFAAFQRFKAEEQSFHAWNAQRLAEAMHARAQASWSAMTLALISTRLGDTGRATRILRLAIERESNPVLRYELLERLGLALAGGGNERAARAPLGSAFRRGSANAGVVLARIDLREGRVHRARKIFRTLLHETPPQSWALRGWGLSMLPQPPSALAPHRTPVTPPH